jgi:formylglycine-generating enzyme required for sulfatase activity
VPAFRIDRTEVRVSEYRHCVEDGACEPPAVASGCNWNEPGRSDHPVNCIDWEQAAAYCSWVGKRLPTEQEWEKAARGTDGRTYPWGNEGPSCETAVMRGARGTGCGQASTAPVASRDRGRSPYGLFDMAGNVHEWTGSVYESGSGARVLRGGSFQNDASAVRASHREGALPNLRDASIGFRCAQGSVVAESGAP